MTEPLAVNQRGRTIDGSDNKAVLGGMRAKNNGRYNGNGREWATPPEVFGPLHSEFYLTLDPCATPENAKCVRFYTEEQNGLEQDWGHERVFMNPPYGREVAAWVKKARESADNGALVVALLPASTDLAWWHEHVVGRAEVRYIRGRVRFLTGGPYRASGFFASVVVIWRPRVGRLHSHLDGPCNAVHGDRHMKLAASCQEDLTICNECRAKCGCPMCRAWLTDGQRS